jgi:hypothetical protein
VLRNVDDAMRRRINIVPFVLKPAVIDKERQSWPKLARTLPEQM